MTPIRTSDAGVTLIEMMIALGLFALIGAAGFSMLDQVLRGQRGSEGRLQHLSEQERALHVIFVDFAMAAPRSLVVQDDSVTLTRPGTNGHLQLGYRLAGDALLRDLGQNGGPTVQTILTGVDAVTWRFLTPDGIWSDTWPIDGVPSLTTPPNPRAVELVIALQGGAGQLRRVAPLPADLD